VVELLQRAQSTSGVREQGRAGRGELHSAGSAFEELGADQCFQTAQALGERRLSDADDPGGVAEVLLIGERHKDLQVSFSEHDPADLG
jgi:hypothetical protein